jgi:hypothetical protein
VAFQMGNGGQKQVVARDEGTRCDNRKIVSENTKF